MSTLELSRVDCVKMGSLIGVLSTEKSKSDGQLLEIARSWDIVGELQFLFRFERELNTVSLNFWVPCAGVDLISGVTCQAPYQWVDKTDDNWEFNTDGEYAETFNVHYSLNILLSNKINCTQWL